MSQDHLNLEALKETLTLTDTSFADDDAQVALIAASRGIDDVCNRRFSKDTQGQTRYYDPISASVCRIGDLVSLTGLHTDPDGDAGYDCTWTTHSDCVLEPTKLRRRQSPLRADPPATPWPLCLTLLRLSAQRRGDGQVRLVDTRPEFELG